MTELRQGLHFFVVNARLLVRGDVIRRTPKVFAEVLDLNPQVTTVVLQDMRGPHNADAIQSIGRDLRARGLGTALQSDSAVYGGAVDLFLSGVSRSMVEGAEIGLGGAVPSAERRGYLEDMLGSDAFYGFALRSSPAGGIHIMTQDEITQYGLLTAPIERKQ